MSSTQMCRSSLKAGRWRWHWQAQESFSSCGRSKLSLEAKSVAVPLLNPTHISGSQTPPEMIINQKWSCKIYLFKTGSLSIWLQLKINKKMYKNILNLMHLIIVSSLDCSIFEFKHQPRDSTVGLVNSMVGL